MADPGFWFGERGLSQAAKGKKKNMGRVFGVLLGGLEPPSSGSATACEVDR